MEKKKILIIADSPLVPSGVGTQTRYMIESMLRTGEFRFVCLAGALTHDDYRPQKVDPYGEDWIIYPVDGYGDQNIVRSIIGTERPDLLWFMTDPRFFPWLWEIENEVRTQIPMVYYHVWDNFPSTHFNGIYYRSTDEVVCISKVTHKILQDVAPNVSSCYFFYIVYTFVRKHHIFIFFIYFVIRFIKIFYKFITYKILV